MKHQNYQNHRRYFIPHHFVFLPAMLFCTGLGVKQALSDNAHQFEWTLFAVLSFAILYLSIMLRQHYALGNQNRIVRLEFRLRYWQLYNEPSAKVEKQLSFPQIAALRFASDEEFKKLLENALQNNTSADDIKRSITNWQADDMRL